MSEITVKELEWRNGYRDWQVKIQTASSGPFYQIREFDGVVWLDADNHQTVYPSVEAAKAAAQADYQGRIRSALELSDDPISVVGWQPIETAPKHGCHVLLYCEYYGVGRCAWESWRGVWRSDDPSHGIGFPEPTHWMPLPNPPIGSTREVKI